MKEEGVFKLWRGATPTVARAMVVNAAQLSTYSQVRVYLKFAKFTTYKKAFDCVHHDIMTRNLRHSGVTRCDLDLLKSYLIYDGVQRVVVNAMGLAGSAVTWECLKV